MKWSLLRRCVSGRLLGRSSARPEAAQDGFGPEYRSAGRRRAAYQASDGRAVAPHEPLTFPFLHARRMSAIRLVQIRKQWGATVALDGIDLEIASSSFCVLLGPSGCGKSTTLRIVAGLETASAGQVFIGGREVTTLPPAQRGISMVFQNYALFPHLTVADNISFGLQVRKVDKAETRRRLERAAELLGLQALLQRKPSQLSGGQQQRVALARALVAQTQVCLMDEPLSNLDAQLRQEMRHELRELQRRLGLTVVYVTHDQAEAMSMPDQGVLLLISSLVSLKTSLRLSPRRATTPMMTAGMRPTSK